MRFRKIFDVTPTPCKTGGYFTFVLELLRLALPLLKAREPITAVYRSRLYVHQSLAKLKTRRAAGRTGWLKPAECKQTKKTNYEEN